MEENVEPQPNKKLLRLQSLSESEDLGSVTGTNAGASSTSGPNIVISRHENAGSPNLLPETSPISAKSQTSEDSSLKGGDSLGSEDSTVDPAHTTPEFIIPSTIKYSSYLCGSQFVDCVADNQILSYNDPKTYPDIQANARAYIAEHFSEAVGTKDLFLRIGKCSIVGKNGYRNARALTSDDDWKKICRALMRLWSTKNLQDVELEIFLDYFTFQTRVISSEPFATTIRNEIHNSLKSSSGEEYLPRAELGIITSNSMVRQIVFEDADLRMEPDEKEIFIQRVQSDAPRLLLMFIDAKLGMTCLKAMLDKGFGDAQLTP